MRIIGTNLQKSVGTVTWFTQVQKKLTILKVTAALVERLMESNVHLC